MRGVDVDIEEPREAYQAAKTSDGLNPHVKRHIWIWLVTTGVFLPICLGLLYVSRYVDPTNPWLNSVRYPLGKVTGFIGAIDLLTGFLVYLELLTNGNLIGRAISTSRGAANFGGFLVLAATLVLVWI